MIERQSSVLLLVFEQTLTFPSLVSMASVSSSRLLDFEWRIKKRVGGPATNMRKREFRSRTIFINTPRKKLGPFYFPTTLKFPFNMDGEAV